MIKEFEGDIKTLTQEEACIVDIWAEWCGPCKVTGKNLETFATDNPEVPIYKVDAEKYPDVTEHFGVMSLPTILYMEGEEVVWKHTGLMTAKQLKDKLGL